MKRYIKSDWSYTNNITDDVPEEIKVFLEKDFSDLDYRTIKDAGDVFFDEYKKIPDGKKGMDSIYDRDKGRFYKKYLPFVRKCKEYMKTLSPTGYGRNDYYDVRKKEICKSVDYNYPYGWKYMI